MSLFYFDIRYKENGIFLIIKNSFRKFGISLVGKIYQLGPDTESFVKFT